MDRFKTYRIFLLKNTGESGLNKEVISRTDIFNLMTKDEYELCADVLARDLNEVYKLTQNVDNVWISGENTNAVQAKYIRGSRSATIGDIFQNCESGDYYVVIPNGFDSLSFSPQHSKRAVQCVL